MRIRHSTGLPAVALAALALAGASIAVAGARGASPSEPGGCEILPQTDAFHQDVSGLDEAENSEA